MATIALHRWATGKNRFSKMLFFNRQNQKWFFLNKNVLPFNIDFRVLARLRWKNATSLKYIEFDMRYVQRIKVPQYIKIKITRNRNREPEHELFPGMGIGIGIGIPIQIRRPAKWTTWTCVYIHVNYAKNNVRLWELSKEKGSFDLLLQKLVSLAECFGGRHTTNYGG